MKCQNKEGYCELSFTKKEIDGIAKATFYINEIKKKQKGKQGLFKELSSFLQDIRDEYFKI